jgi:hypothetical protein
MDEAPAVLSNVELTCMHAVAHHQFTFLQRLQQMLVAACNMCLVLFQTFSVPFQYS